MILPFFRCNEKELNRGLLSPGRGNPVTAKRLGAAKWLNKLFEIGSLPECNILARRLGGVGRGLGQPVQYPLALMAPISIINNQGGDCTFAQNRPFICGTLRTYLNELSDCYDNRLVWPHTYNFIFPRWMIGPHAWICVSVIHVVLSYLSALIPYRYIISFVDSVT